ncbi:MurR/RpiR family transcriptional regulator [Spiroplasma taiwanense]|uniref:Transcriptional regulator n=1 Tax=Spiroplasma taiwanense CT-1 TaxID=1276220 RepID=S5MH33_9MOLU|nr:transcriptional regulator [Spiroplasma taiwanense]AGR41150.1 transcriptional regulator [Spiroplasma taiwanense CT-1]
MESIFEKLENTSKDFKDTTFKLIANQILSCWQTGAFKNQETLSKECFVSNSIITKFSKGLGYSGYRELLFELKREYNHYSFKNENFDEFKFENFIYSLGEWIKENSNFIKKISKNLINVKFVKIYSSYQSRLASKYLFELLLMLGKVTVIIEQEYSLLGNPIADENSLVNILILAGRDNDTLIRKFNNDVNKNSNCYLITTSRQVQKMENSFQETLLIDFEFDNSSFFYRNIALELLFLEIFHQIM